MKKIKTILGAIVLCFSLSISGAKFRPGQKLNKNPNRHTADLSIEKEKEQVKSIEIEFYDKGFLKITTLGNAGKKSYLNYEDLLNYNTDNLSITLNDNYDEGFFLKTIKEVLNEYPNLSSLIINDNGSNSVNIDDQLLQQIGSLEELQEFAITNPNQEIDCTYLTNLADLKNLRIGNAVVKNSEALSSLKALETISLKDIEGLNTDWIESVLNLRELSLINCVIKNVGNLNNLQKLEKLDLRDNLIASFSSSLISQLERLNYLRIDGNPFISLSVNDINELYGVQGNTSSLLQNSYKEENVSNSAEVFQNYFVLGAEGFSNILPEEVDSMEFHLGYWYDSECGINHVKLYFNNNVIDTTNLSELANVKTSNISIIIGNDFKLNNLEITDLIEELFLNNDLKSIMIVNNSDDFIFGDELLRKIGKIKTLENLIFVNMKEGLNCYYYANMDNLKQFKVINSNFDNLDKLGNVDTLETLYLDEINNLNVSDIVALKNLKNLYIKACEIGNMSKLGKLEGLEILHLEDASLDKDSILYSSSFPNLKYYFISQDGLEFSLNEFLSLYGIDKSDLDKNVSGLLKNTYFIKGDITIREAIISLIKAGILNDMEELKEPIIEESTLNRIK